MNKKVTDQRLRISYSWTWLTDLLGIVVLSFIFYALWLNSYPLFTPDEGRYSEIAREMITTRDFITPRIDGMVFLDKPILFYLLQALTINFFGIKEWALRLIPMLFGVLGAAITYLSGRYLFNRLTGLFSAVILTTTPLYFVGAHYANLDLMLAVLISTSLLLFIIATQSKKKARIYYLGVFIFTALAVLTKGLIGILFPCLIICIWMIFQPKHQLLLRKIPLITGFFLFLLIVLPWYILVQINNPEFFYHFFIIQQLKRFLSTEAFNNQVPFWFYLPIVIIGFFPWSVFLIQACLNSVRNIKKKFIHHSNELFLLIWIATILIFFSIPHAKSISYILPIFPALSLLVGSYLATYWNHIQQKEIILSNIIFILLAIILTAFLLLLPWTEWIKYSPEFNKHILAITLLLLTTVVVSLCHIKKTTFLPLFSTYIICSITFLLLLVSGASYLNHDSIKPLVAILKQNLHQEESVISYFTYYQDLPLYLGRQVIVVANWNSPDIAHRDNWARELWFGKGFQQSSHVLISEQAFIKVWNNHAKIFVLLNNNFFDQFKVNIKKYYILATHHQMILLSNRPSDK